MENDTGPLLNLWNAAPDIISVILGSLPLRERFVCALVCKAWAEAASAATHSIILKHKVQDVSGLQQWLEKHGNMLEVLQLHAGYKAALSAAQGWAAAGCPGLQELKALTSLKLASSSLVDIPASQLTALRQLDVPAATPTALNQLHLLIGLTQLCVWQVTGLSPESPPLQLPGLQDLQLHGEMYSTMSMSFLASCTQLQLLNLWGIALKGPGSLVAGTVLQHLQLDNCSIADSVAGPVPWQQVFPGPGRLPHLTYLQLWTVQPELQQADMDSLVKCCSSLQDLYLSILHKSCAPVLARLPGLTNLRLHSADDEQCSAMVQLTGLKQLAVWCPRRLSVVGLRQLAALKQLTSLGLGGLSGSQLKAVAGHLMRDDLEDCSHAIVNQAPSGSPPDVSSRLLDVCNVVNTCEGLSIGDVVQAAVEMKLSGLAGDGRPKPLTAQALLVGAAALRARALRH